MARLVPGEGLWAFYGLPTGGRRLEGVLLVAARVLRMLDPRERASWTRHLALACLATLADRVAASPDGGETERGDGAAAAEE
eukprot:8274133-Pyramimonas_sp.AAC.1